MPRHPTKGWTNPMNDIKMQKASHDRQDKTGSYKGIQGKPGVHTYYTVYFPYWAQACFKSDEDGFYLGLYCKCVKNYKDAVFLANKAGPGSHVSRRVEAIRKVKMGDRKSEFILGVSMIRVDKNIYEVK